MQSACAILSSVACLAVSYFSTLCHKGTIFEKSVTEHKICILIFSTNLSETYFIIRRIQRDIVINVHRFMYSSSYSYQIAIKDEFSQQIFEKQPNVKFNENPSSGSQVDGQTDR